MNVLSTLTAPSNFIKIDPIFFTISGTAYQILALDANGVVIDNSPVIISLADMFGLGNATVCRNLQGVLKPYNQILVTLICADGSVKQVTASTL